MQSNAIGDSVNNFFKYFSKTFNIYIIYTFAYGQTCLFIVKSVLMCLLVHIVLIVVFKLCMNH